MPPKVEKRVSVEEMIDVFLDPRVVEAISKALNPSIRELLTNTIDSKMSPISASISSLSDIVHKFEEKIDSKISPILESISTLSDNLQKFEGRIQLLSDQNENLVDQNQNLVDENSKLKAQIKDLSNYSRRDNLIVQGLEVTSYSEAAAQGGNSINSTLLESNVATEKAVIDLARSVGVLISENDISVAHRLPVKNNTPKPGAARRPAPIIVKFVRRRTRDQLFAARKQLKTMRPGVYINEHLTAENASLHRAARECLKQKKLFSTWTSQGEVFIKLTSAPDCQPVKLTRAELLPA